MFKFILKSGTYLYMFRKYKQEIVSMIISLLLIWLIFGIYDDLIKIFHLVDTSSLLYFLFGKWFLIVMIIVYNIVLFKSIRNSIDKDEILEEEIVLPKKSQDILAKKNILTTTDLILKKYSK